MVEPLLAARKLCRRFGGVLATDDVSFDLRPGECHALIGPNGAGKSTLVGLLAGEIAPDQGSVILLGRDVTRLGVAARARAGLGRTFQITQLCIEASVAQNVALAIQGHQRSHAVWAAPADARPFLPADLAARADDPVAALSHGERKQLELIVALAARPAMLLLDEPAAGLGAAETRAMAADLARLKGSIAMLLVEHDTDTVFALADRISVLDRGRIIASGPPAAIRADPAVRAAYLGQADA